MSEKDRVTPQLISNGAMDQKQAADLLYQLSSKQDVPAVMRVIRKHGFWRALDFEKARRESCQPFRADEWAQIMGAPFDRSGESCIKIKYADGKQMVVPIAEFVWQTMGMDRVRLQYVDKAEAE